MSASIAPARPHPPAGVRADPLTWMVQCSAAARGLVAQFNRRLGQRVIRCDPYYHGPRDAGFLLVPVENPYRWLRVCLEDDGDCGLFVCDRQHDPEFRNQFFCQFESAGLRVFGEVMATPERAAQALVSPWLALFA